MGRPYPFDTPGRGRLERWPGPGLRRCRTAPASPARRSLRSSGGSGAPGAPQSGVHPAALDQLGATGGSDVKLVGAKGSVVLPIAASHGIERGVVWVPFNQGGGNVENLIDASAPVNDVRIEVL